MFENINLKISKKQLTINDVIVFHPIFEAIHPFSDGNGRIGRLLLTCLFISLGVGQDIPILLSHFLAKEISRYHSELQKIQLSNK